MIASSFDMMTPLTDLTSAVARPDNLAEVISKPSLANGCRLSPTGEKPSSLNFHDDIIASNHLIQVTNF